MNWSKTRKSGEFTKNLYLGVLNAGFFNMSVLVICSKEEEKIKDSIKEHINLLGYETKIEVVDNYKMPENTRGSSKSAKKKEFIGYLIKPIS